jgi:uncharacterized protein YjbI with pentapeptide repeats
MTDTPQYPPLEIRNRWTNDVIYSSAKAKTLRDAVIEAVASRADLSDADMSGVNLSAADLSGADMSGVNLRDANLSGADLSGANLSDADLSGAAL